MATLDRMQAGVDQANVNQANANASQQAAIGSIIGGVTGMGSALLQSGALNSDDATDDKAPIIETVVDEVSQPSSNQESNFNLLFNTPSLGDLSSGNN
jgi:hypothetical protein